MKSKEVYTSIQPYEGGMVAAIIVGPGGWGCVTVPIPASDAISAAKRWAHTLGVEFRYDGDTR